VDPQDRAVGSTVNMTLKIDEQSKVRVRNLDIVGNEITQDKVIRREISRLPGRGAEPERGREEQAPARVAALTSRTSPPTS